MTEIPSVSGLRGVREALAVAQETIDGWVEDADGYVHVHPDVISKAVNAAVGALSLPTSPQPVSDAEQLVWRACDLLERAKEAMECDPQADVVGEDCWTWIKQTEIWLDELNRAPAGAQGQVQGVQQSEDSSSHPPSKLDGSMATASDSVSAGSIVVKRIFEIQQWVLKVAPHVLEQQKHLDEGSPERAYWHYGYLCALNDVLEKLAAMPSPSDAVAENAAHPEVVEKTLAVSAPPADVSSQAGQAVTRMEDGGAMGSHYVAAPSAGSGQEGLRELLQAVLNCETCHDEKGHAYLKVPARSLNDLGALISFAIKDTRQEWRLRLFTGNELQAIHDRVNTEKRKHEFYWTTMARLLNDRTGFVAALLPPASKPSAAMNEISLVKLVLSAHQTAYARFHCTEKRGVIESHGMAIGYASVELAKALRGEK